MKESTKKKWVPMTLVFLSVVGSFAALMYLSIVTFSNPRTNSNPYLFRFQQSPVKWSTTQDAAIAAANKLPTKPGWHKMVLVRDREVRVGGSVLTYRGLGGSSTIRIDAVIPDLDSQYTYRQRFDIDQARESFKVGGERLKLLSAGRYKVRIKHYVPSR